MTRPFYFSMKGEEASQMFLFIVVCVQRNLHIYNKQKKKKKILLEQNVVPREKHNPVGKSLINKRDFTLCGAEVHIASRDNQTII